MEYTVRIGEEEYLLRISGSGESLKVSRNGEEIPVDFREMGPGTYSLLLRGRSHLITAEREEAGIRIHLDGRACPARVGRAGDEEAENSPDAGGREVRSIMPGIVTRLLAGVGDAVQAGDPLLVLEAMKMENEVRSHREGKVAEIHVREGEAVDAGAPLVTLE
jgi:biotin carboxyl carrier protein